MQYYQQFGVNDCGPACLAMIASHYNSFVHIGEMRRLCKTDVMGTNLIGLNTAAEQHGFNAKAYKGNISNNLLDVKMIFPFIAQIKTQFAGSTYDHFVVIKKITSKAVEIWDPNPSVRKHRISRKDFLEIWTGYVLFITPSLDFSPKKTENSLHKYLPLLIPHKENLIAVCFASAIIILFGILISFYYKYIVDEVIIANAAFTLAYLSIGVLIITVIQSIIEALRTLFINHFVYKSNLQLDLSYVTHILNLPISFFDAMRTGEILSRMTDIAKIGSALSGTALTLVMDVVLILVIGPLLYNISSLLFVICTVSVLLMSVIILFFSKLYRRYYTQMRQEEAMVSSTLVELVNGAYTVKAHNAEQMTFDGYEKNRMASVWTSWKANNTRIIQRLLTGIINGVNAIIIFWVGSNSIIDGTFSIGSFLSFSALSVYFTGPLFRLVNIQSDLQEAYVAAERVSEILEMDIEQPEKEQLVKPVSLEGNIHFNNVFFKYGMRPLIYKDLSFNIEKGQWVAFVGPSGCGKSTLIKLLLKFYEPEQGVISIDGQDIKYVDATALRKRIGYVPQDIFIFASTIKDNIALNNPQANIEDVINAAKRAGADDFINNLPEGYNTKVSEQGTTLSGGERQRLALARALMDDPDIIILDEATSNLDTISENNIHKVIEEMRGSITTILIAHRLTTVRNCDVIFVMEKGCIIESGCHEELLRQNGLYKKLWEETEI